MKQSHDLLFELGCEELPPKSLTRLARALSQSVQLALKQHTISFESIQHYASPRRLALVINSVARRQDDQVIERRGPPIKAAYDAQGRPTKAALGFAQSLGVDITELTEITTDKGQWLGYNSLKKGENSESIIPGILQQALATLPVAKPMRWGDKKIQFIRPVHWLVLLLDDRVIDCEILAIKADRFSRGHRVHSPDAFAIDHAKDYVQSLKEHSVLVDIAQRQDTIKQQIENCAQTINGQLNIDPELLDEVTQLVEWPVALVGQFDTDFLQIPKEALISSMQGHQKYFPVFAKDNLNELLPYFITVANLASNNTQEVIAGNERVIRPRLSDAAFFFNLDKKQPLQSRLPGLNTLIFQNKLGTMGAKVERIKQLASDIAQHIAKAQDLDPKIQAQKAQQAAKLCKCDLLSDMVGEFPELQGIMGYYYALHDGVDEITAVAINEHYMPRFAGDQLPKTITGQALAIADRIDTLVGLFAIKQPPTGTKDPFALRRGALGVLRIIIEQALPINLLTSIKQSISYYPSELVALDQNDPQALAHQIFDFIQERLKAFYDERGISPEVFQAVKTRRPEQPLDFDHRIQAVHYFSQLPSALSLSSANKRVSNILNKQGLTTTDKSVDTNLLELTQEKDLYAKVQELTITINPLLQRRQYQEVLQQLAELKQPVDAFFDHVIVMADQENIRNNRLTLLSELRQLFLNVADISLLSSN